MIFIFFFRNLFIWITEISVRFHKHETHEMEPVRDGTRISHIERKNRLSRIFICFMARYCLRCGLLLRFLCRVGWVCARRVDCKTYIGGSWLLSGQQWECEVRSLHSRPNLANECEKFKLRSWISQFIVTNMRLEAKFTICYFISIGCTILKVY